MRIVDKQLYKVARRALVRIGVKPGLRILDFGARIGNYALPAANLVTGTGKVYALDKDREQLDELMTIGGHLPQLARIDTDGGSTISLPQDSLNMILLFDVDLDDPTPYLKEFHRVLTPNGILAVYLPIESNRDRVRCEEFMTNIKRADFRLSEKVEQEMVHWDWVEEATVYLFQPRGHLSNARARLGQCMLDRIKNNLSQLGNPEKARILSQFFKTGKGQYGEGDVFLGISVPEQRKIAKKYFDLPLNDLQELLDSEIHEHRLTALLILIHKYRQADSAGKNRIFRFYLKNTENINNWDLVDLTAPKIVGNYLLNKDRSFLYKLAKSNNLWERRIAILSTLNFIRNNDFEDTLKISELLLHDKHDLIHKAVGWMLREIGKKDQEVEERFLIKHKIQMPRTMLRYAIEKFDENKRKFYLSRG
ncbi:MAG: DNA alkylation repair protein [Candidatus Bathyarchaeota archaeon]|nr:MAG: DNA alkylation repair protein [Candidatus Bathyarchaeota archaeon]